MDYINTNNNVFNVKKSIQQKFKSSSNKPISLKISNLKKIRSDNNDRNNNKNKDKKMLAKNAKSKSTFEIVFNNENINNSNEYNNNKNHNKNYSNIQSNNDETNNNVNKNNIIKKSQSNSLFSTSISLLELRQKNENIFLQMRIGETKQKIAKLKRKLNRKNLDITNIQNILTELKNNKKSKQRELEDFLSNKESLEEILRVLIQDNLNSQRELINRIKIDKNDIINCPTEKLIELTKNVFEDLKFQNINIIINLIKKNLDNKKTIQEGKIDSFLNNIIQSIKKINKEIINETQLLLLFKYLIKISYLDQKIQESFNYIKKEYKEKKKDAKDKLNDLENTKELIEEKIVELNNLIEELESKLNKMNITNSFKSNLFLIKENNFELTNKKKNNLSKSSSRDKNINYFKSKAKTSDNYQISINNLNSNIEGNKNDSYKLIYPSNNISIENQILKTQTSPISTVTSSRFNILLNNKNLNTDCNDNSKNNNLFDESFCYFKIINKYERRFNPLNVTDKTPEFIGYNIGLISIDFTNKLLLLTDSKIDEKNIFNHKNKNLKIDFKQLSNIIIQNYMKGIIKIYTFYLKYNQKCEKEPNRNIRSLNKFIHLKELNDIDMDDNQKIKSALCKYFSFTIVLSEKKNLEVIFLNFNEFKFWYNGISLIVKNNKKSKSKDKNDVILGKIIKHKKNNSYSFKRFYTTGQLSQNISTTNLNSIKY